MTRYKIYQAVESAMLFTLSIVTWGCFDGWTRIPEMLDKHSGGANFCIFLTILESLGFEVACVLGVVCIFLVSKVPFPNPCNML